MKKLNLNLLMILAVIFSLSIVTTSCSDDDGGGTAIEDLDGDGIADSEDDDIDGDGVPNDEDPDPTNPDVPNDDGTPDPVSVSGFLTEDQTWTNDRFWILEGKTYVQAGVTLTIEPGTIIKGSPSSGSNASALIVAQDGTLIADGTAQQPIIFTGEADNIALGETAGTNLGINDRQLWGGVLVLGNAPGSFSGDAESIQVEGLPPDEPGSYGGNDPADSSGVLNYISIRHGGAVIGSDNEINGLTLAGVGNSTQVSNIEVVANLDDGVEYFGGTVDSSNILVWGCGDDQLDLDEAYSGTVSNALTIQTNVSDHGLEIDGPAGSFQDSFTIDGLTMIGDSSSQSGANTGNREYSDLRDGARCMIKNVYAYGFLPGSDVEFDDDDTATNYNDGNITFENWQIVYPQGDDNLVMWNNTSGVQTSFSSDADSWTTSIQEGNQTTGADLSVFGWTYAASKNAF